MNEKINTLKEKSGSIFENKTMEVYISPSCEVYNLQSEGMICTSGETYGSMEEADFGGSAGF